MKKKNYPPSVLQSSTYNKVNIDKFCVKAVFNGEVLEIHSFLQQKTKPVDEEVPNNLSNLF